MPYELQLSVPLVHVQIVDVCALSLQNQPVPHVLLPESLQVPFAGLSLVDVPPNTPSRVQRSRLSCRCPAVMLHWVVLQQQQQQQKKKKASIGWWDE